jgi:mono/diheme cytochrome c family protein
MRWNLCAVLIAATLLLAGCQPYVRIGTPDRPAYEPLAGYVQRMNFIPEKPNAEEGKKVYDARCAVCHGPDGRGDGPMAERLVAPRVGPLNDVLRIFRIQPVGEPLPSRPVAFHTVELMRMNSPFSMFEVIDRGRPYTAMPGFGHPAYGAVSYADPPLSDEEIWNVLFWAWSRMTTRERLAEGRRIYQQQCAVCHGVLGDGDGPEAARFRGELWTWGRGIGPGIFTDRDWMAHRKPTELYQRVFDGVRRRGVELMPAFGDRLSPDEIWAVVDYLWTFVYALPEDRR